MSLHDELRTFLARVRRRWFWCVALRTAGRAAAAAALPAFAGVLVVWLIDPRGVPLAGLAAVAVLVSLAGTAVVLWHMPRRPGDTQVARFIEERVQTSRAVTLDDALVSAVEGERAAPSDFRGLLIDAAVRRLQGLDAGDVVSGPILRRMAAQAIGGLALLGLAVAMAYGPFNRAIDAAAIALFPNAVHVEVLPGDTRVVAGQPLTIRAILRSRGNEVTRVTPSLTVTTGTGSRTVPMAPDGDGFRFSFESIDRTFRYHVAAGAARSGEHTVMALFPPRVRQIDLDYEYPAFAGLKPRREQDSGDIYAPQGTRVRLRIHADKPVVAGQLAFAGGQPSALSRVDTQVLEASLVLSKDDSYRIGLDDGDGLSSTGDTEYFIRIMDDRPPDVRILRPAGDQQITPLEEVAIEARAEDDYGIGRFELVYSIPGGVSKTVSFAGGPGTETTRQGSVLLAAEELGVRPGDVITYFARARDIGRGKRPTEVRSDLFFLEVRPFSEEFVAAQSQAMSGMSGTQIESLIAAQKEIINATWNIERRAVAGRSADDIRAVAQAQAELKARVEQMTLNRGRGRMRFEPPQQVAPRRQPSDGRRPAGDPIGAAVQAMALAQQHLDKQRTGEAIPHEMSALRGLLQAQAEIRRRQIMQQQAGGSGGGAGRQGEDLSALFDRELQRQQRTNYETRSQIEERPDQPDDRTSALDRIRDLAKRQEELSRQQRNLVESTLSEEERTRQLQRLQREQAELQRQAEALAQQMQQRSAGGQRAQSGQQGQPSGSGRQQAGDRAAGQSQSGRSGQSSSGGADLRGATEQMRSAASELRREDAGRAADSAARAADELRRVEQRLRGDTPAARERTAGELQLEAQQLADEQRRIAAEAQRLGKGEGGAKSDARRRLAGEKDRLADRVDALQKGLSQLEAESGRGGQSDRDRTGRAGEAARELERRQVSQRMRETAETLRKAGTPDGGSDGKSTADAEQQIARALDRVVDELGAATAEARSLSSELQRMADIRERLDRLEQQIRDLESRQGQGDGRAAGDSQSSEQERLRQEYARELREARATLDRLARGDPRTGPGGATPERHEWSQADPGDEAFKQDLAAWQSLRKDVDLALERREDVVSAKLATQQSADRLSAGGSDRVPDAYRRLIARYYEALARKKQ